MTSKLLIRVIVVLSTLLPVAIAFYRLIQGGGIETRLLVYLVVQAIVAIGLLRRVSVVRWIGGSIWCVLALSVTALSSFGSVVGGPSLALNFCIGSVYLFCGILVMTPLVSEYFAKQSTSKAAIV